jgi:hypothetical protein
MMTVPGASFVLYSTIWRRRCGANSYAGDWEAFSRGAIACGTSRGGLAGSGKICRKTGPGKSSGSTSANGPVHPAVLDRTTAANADATARR